MSDTHILDGVIPDVITHYFALDGDRDIESIVSLFSDDATVIDQGHTYRGIAEIHAWQTGAASEYIYSTQLFSAKPVERDRFVVTGRLTGNFPGGTAVLTWDFTLAADRITRLVHHTAQ
ncbi:MAG: hypothetical protein QOJ85_4796 [Solirubrobacteraceae bacterium]|jgi:hypothetical protein|nr:hypothetical protein [Actinomycetota bacterium]MEA2131905.1 hypothetical protein [Solirubrobacteraceae bacterium]MEA2244833.1 hypothetical protein [Solirubrobacteraceae bacterium]